MKPLVAVVGAVIALFAWGHFGWKTRVRPYDPNGAVARYLADFRGYGWMSDGSDRFSPDGSARVIDDTLFHPAGCHTLWYKPRHGLPRRVVRVAEMPAGSGSTWSIGWSADSQALYIMGNHGGYDCKGGPAGRVDVIYTVSDGAVWELPPEDLDASIAARSARINPCATSPCASSSPLPPSPKKRNSAPPSR